MATLEVGQQYYRFILPVDKDNVLRIVGEYLVPPGERALLGIESDVLKAVPEGMTESPLGLHYFYLFGDDNPTKIDREFYLEGYESDKIEIIFRRWYSESEMRFNFSGSEEDNVVFVLGSCVSRDSFEIQNALPLSGYRARTSFASLSSPPVLGYQTMDLSENKSPFQQRMVRGDLAKDAVKAVRFSQGGNVLVDFIDERIPLVRVGESIVSKSTEFLSTRLEFENTKGMDIFSEEYYRLFARGWLEFIDGVSPKNVIVNKVFWASTTDEGLQLPNVEIRNRENRKLDRLYAIVKALTPDVAWISYREEDLVAKSDHKWGVSPFHFVDSMLKEQQEQLRSILLRQRDLGR